MNKHGVIPELGPVETARFWNNVDIRGEDECWPWKRCLNDRGYGAVGVTIAPGINRVTRASRVAWRLANGVDPIGKHVCHTCDNRKCCNPKHMFLGTDKDNHSDMRKKGRHVNPPYKPGSENGNSKHTKEVALRVRSLRAKGWTYLEISEDVEIPIGTVANIVKRRTWKHI